MHEYIHCPYLFKPPSLFKKHIVSKKRFELQFKYCFQNSLSFIVQIILTNYCFVVNAYNFGGWHIINPDNRCCDASEHIYILQRPELWKINKFSMTGKLRMTTKNILGHIVPYIILVDCVITANFNSYGWHIIPLTVAFIQKEDHKCSHIKLKVHTIPNDLKLLDVPYQLLNIVCTRTSRTSRTHVAVQEPQFRESIITGLILGLNYPDFCSLPMIKNQMKSFKVLLNHKHMYSSLYYDIDTVTLKLKPQSKILGLKWKSNVKYKQFISKLSTTGIFLYYLNNFLIAVYICVKYLEQKYLFNTKIQQIFQNYYPYGVFSKQINKLIHIHIGLNQLQDSSYFILCQSQLVTTKLSSNVEIMYHSAVDRPSRCFPMTLIVLSPVQRILSIFWLTGLQKITKTNFKSNYEKYYGTKFVFNYTNMLQLEKVIIPMKYNTVQKLKMQPHYLEGKLRNVTKYKKLYNKLKSYIK